VQLICIYIQIYKWSLRKQGMDWIKLVPSVNTATNFYVWQRADFLSSWSTISISRIQIHRVNSFCMCLINYVSTAPWRYMAEWKYGSTILVLGTRWTWLASFTLPLNIGRFPFNQRIAGVALSIRWHYGLGVRIIVPEGSVILSSCPKHLCSSSVSYPMCSGGTGS
jgi:hypothetical protein